MALTDSLIAYYKMEGNSNDSVGSNNGTDAGITYSADNGKIGQGAGMNGGYIVGGSNIGITGNATLSVSAWVKFNALSNTAIWGFGNGGVPLSACSLFLDTSGNLSMQFAGGNSYVVSSGLTTGVWYNIIVTKSAGSINSTISIYVNNVLKTVNGTPSTGTPNIATSGFAIGRFTPSDNPASPNCAQDEVAVWSRVIDSVERTLIYNAGAGLQYPFTLGNPGAFFLMF